MRRSACLLALAIRLAAADPDPEFTEEAVSVRGLPLLPLSNLAVGDQAFEVHPKGLFGIGWDDNPYGSQSGDQRGDAFARLVAGAELRAQGRDGWRADFDGALDAQQYVDTPGRDFLGGNAILQLRRVSETTTAGGKVAWTRDDEPVVLLPDAVPRERLSAGIAATHDGRAGLWEVRVSWDGLNYLEDGPTFNRNERDYRRWSLGGAWALSGAESTRLGVEAEAEDVQRSASARISDHRAATARLRWRHAVAERSILDLRLGGTIRRHAEPTAGLASNADRVILAPSAQFLFTWSWEDRSRATVAWATGLGEAVDENANAARRQAVEVWYRQRLRDRLEVVTYGMWQQRDDTGSTSGTTEAQHRFLQLETGCEYRLRYGIALRPLVSWRYNDTQPGLTSNRLVAALEIAAAF